MKPGEKKMVVEALGILIKKLNEALEEIKALKGKAT